MPATEGVTAGAVRTSPIDALLRASPAYTNVITRARFSEEALLASVSGGVRQYVLLGAGFDSFALRVPVEAQHLEIFEVDLPATQSLKKLRLAECGLSVSPRVHFVTADLAVERLEEVLLNAGFRREMPAFFSWLGVTMYLTQAANLAALSAIAHCASPGSELVFNYIDQAAFGGTKQGPSADFVAVQTVVTAMGEPFLSGFHPATLATDLRALGLELEEDVGEPALVQAYDPLNINSLRPVAELHTARARVLGSSRPSPLGPNPVRCRR
jgi:methyltransferase (TIGR00027 family)